MKPLWIVIALLSLPAVAIAAESPARQVYGDAIELAATGHDSDAVARLQGAAAMLAADDIWAERMELAAGLIGMRRQQAMMFSPVKHPSSHAALAAAYLKQIPGPETTNDWVSGILATVLPGAGHGWQGRWRDALTAALMVWPMLLLTLWAAYRRMGPVTVFFALITAWLWSGTIFSAISLAERGSYEAYLLWWQGLWQASGLPGRPW